MSSQQTSTESVFNVSECDVILVSSDKVQLGVHKAILSNASSVFEDMFSLPTVAPSDEKSVIPVTEPSALLEQLLRFCYPSLNGRVVNFEMLRLLFAAAEKYEMKGVISQLAYILRHEYSKKEPYRAYALACIYALWDEAQLAGKNTLSHSLPGPALPEYDTLPASMYHKLIVYRLQCIGVIDLVLKNWKETICSNDWGWTGPECNHCSKSTQDGPSCWFLNHLNRLKEAFAEIPRGRSVVSTHLLLVTLKACFSGIGLCACCAVAPVRLIEFNRRLATILDQKLGEVRTSNSCRANSTN
jgi:hypothetical protein